MVAVANCGGITYPHTKEPMAKKMHRRCSLTTAFVRIVIVLIRRAELFGATPADAAGEIPSMEAFGKGPRLPLFIKQLMSPV